MKLKWMLITAAFIGGIYIASDEGKQIRKALEKKKSTFKPIVDNLLEEANKVLKGAESIKSSEIRANVEKLIFEAKTTLKQIDLSVAIDVIKDSIKVSSKKIREAFSFTEQNNSALNEKPVKIKSKVFTRNIKTTIKQEKPNQITS